jgi:MFS family permease
MNASKNAGRGNFFYGWWIVAGGFFIMATCYTAFVNCIPLFQTYVVSDLGLTVGQFNTGVSLCTIVAVFASLAIGKLLDVWDARLLGAFTVISSAVVLIGLSSITELWQLYALCILAGMIVVAGTRLLVSVLIANWFTLKRGLAVSIALSGSGVGGVLLSPITSTMIVAYGWRPAFVVLGVVCLVFALPLVLIAFRNRPSDKGLEPYGWGLVEQTAADRSPDTPVGVSVGWKVVRKSGAFWMLILGFVMMGIDNGAIITNSIANMTSVTLSGTEIIIGGHDALWAGYVWALYLGCVIVCKISLGVIYDRWGMKTGTVLGTLASFLAAIALCFPSTDWGPILAAVLFAFGTCMGTVAPPMMTVKEFGKKDLGMLTGVVTAFEMLGAAIGSVVSGVLFDSYSSFVPAWIMVMVATVIMAAALLYSIVAARKVVAARIAQGAPLLDAEGFEVTA